MDNPPEETDKIIRGERGLSFFVVLIWDDSSRSGFAFKEREHTWDEEAYRCLRCRVWYTGTPASELICNHGE